MDNLAELQPLMQEETGTQCLKQQRLNPQERLMKKKNEPKSIHLHRFGHMTGVSVALLLHQIDPLRLQSLFSDTSYLQARCHFQRDSWSRWVTSVGLRKKRTRVGITTAIITSCQVRVFTTVSEKSSRRLQSSHTLCLTWHSGPS